MDFRQIKALNLAPQRNSNDFEGRTTRNPDYCESYRFARRGTPLTPVYSMQVPVRESLGDNGQVSRSAGSPTFSRADRQLLNDATNPKIALPHDES
jgi:hypothetical protein